MMNTKWSPVICLGRSFRHLRTDFLLAFDRKRAALSHLEVDDGPSHQKDSINVSSGCMKAKHTLGSDISHELSYRDFILFEYQF